MNSTKFSGQQMLKKAKFAIFGLEKAHLATLTWSSNLERDCGGVGGGTCCLGCRWDMLYTCHSMLWQQQQQKQKSWHHHSTQCFIVMLWFRTAEHFLSFRYHRHARKFFLSATHIFLRVDWQLTAKIAQKCTDIIYIYMRDRNMHVCATKIRPASFAFQNLSVSTQKESPFESKCHMHKFFHRRFLNAAILNNHINSPNASSFYIIYIYIFSCFQKMLPLWCSQDAQLYICQRSHTRHAGILTH